MRIRGRPRIVQFPIQRTEVAYGRSRVRTVEGNAAVNCLRCGQRFLINQDTAHYVPGPSDMPVVRCPRCNYLAAVCYYYDQTDSPERRKRL